MNLRFQILIIMCSAISTVGCSTLSEPKMTGLSLGSDAVVFGLPSLSSTTVSAENSKIRTCLGRGADTTFNDSQSGDMSIALVSSGSANENDDVNDSSNSGESEMSGRTPGVLMAREMFYRTCEFINNHQLTTSEALQLYLHTIDAVSKGWESELQKTTITLTETSTITDTNTASEMNDTTDSVTTNKNLTSATSEPQ